MKVKIVLGVVALLSGLSGYVFSQAQSMQSPFSQIVNKNELADSPEILNATLQIEATLPDDADGDRFVIARGLGSLIRNDGAMYLVTHNHWGNILRKGCVVAIYDVHGKLLKTMSASEFKGLISYQDAGSLILRVPLNWMVQAIPLSAGDPLEVEAGDIVLVAQWHGSKRKEVILVEAEVVSVIFYEGMPVYRLNLPEGHAFQGGDSGGGVWHKGKLVGITYATILVEPFLFKLIPYRPDVAGLEKTPFGYAARYPADQLRSISAIWSSDKEIRAFLAQSLDPSSPHCCQRD